MEQKRTLWIVVASGIFLLVVMGAAIGLYAPEARKNTDAQFQNNAGNIWMAVDSSSAPINLKTDDKKLSNDEKQTEDILKDEIPLAPNLKDDEGILTIFSDSEKEKVQASSEQKVFTERNISTENLTVYANGVTKVYGQKESEGGMTIDLNSATITNSFNTTTINDQRTSVVPQNEKTKRAYEKNQMLKESKKTVTASSKKVQPKIEKKEVKKAEQKKSTSKPAAKIVAAKIEEKVPDRFWIQVGSYSTKKNADEARVELDKNSFQCEVFTIETGKNSLNYRVRVGPYTTKSEANYWKQKIDSLEMFKNAKSYVVNSSAKK